MQWLGGRRAAEQLGGNSVRLRAGRRTSGLDRSPSSCRSPAVPLPALVVRRLIRNRRSGSGLVRPSGSRCGGTRDTLSPRHQQTTTGNSGTGARGLGLLVLLIGAVIRTDSVRVAYLAGALAVFALIAWRTLLDGRERSAIRSLASRVWLAWSRP